MNKQGQTLVMFIILLPIFLMLGALIIDTGIVINQKITINSIINNDTNIDDIKKNLENNKIEIKNIKQNGNCVIIESRVESIFGKIIGKNEYEIVIENCE